ncbi:MAG: hypothetical protein EOM02_13400 [Synergistales bacterium]|nr:hypothetical protein [Synergistales bacterium]
MAFTADIYVRSDLMKAFASGIKLSQRLKDSGWVLSKSQADLSGNSRRIRVLVYNTGQVLTSGTVVTLDARLLANVGCLASKAVTIAQNEDQETPQIGKMDGSVETVNSDTTQEQVDSKPVPDADNPTNPEPEQESPSTGGSDGGSSGGGCSVGHLTAGSLLLVAPMMMFFHRR